MGSRYWVYYGSGASGEGQGVYVQLLDVDTLERGELKHVAGGEAMGFLAATEDGSYLYAIEAHSGRGCVSAFSINRKTGELTSINRQPTDGGKLTYVGLSRDGSCILTAGYGDAMLSVLKVSDTGKALPPSSTIQLAGSSGVVANRQEKAHAHSIYADPTDQYVLACDLGNDMVYQFDLDRSQGVITPARFAFARTYPGAGPRHMAFHPNKKWAYVINELGNTVTHFEWDSEVGTLIERDSVNTLPDGFEGDNTTAEVVVSPDGRFVYGSNRGHESIVVFAVDRETGALEFVQREPTHGRHPRNFNIDPTGRVMIVGNANTDNATFYRIDDATGRLTYTEKQVHLPKPICIRFVEADVR